MTDTPRKRLYNEYYAHNKESETVRHDAEDAVRKAFGLLKDAGYDITDVEAFLTGLVACEASEARLLYGINRRKEERHTHLDRCI